MRQGTPEWLQARCGHVTASEFSAVMAKGQGVTRAKYLRQVLAERLTGVPHVGYRNADMDRGQEQEAAARLAYEAQTGAMCEEVGFLTHPRVPNVGCSPDSLVDDDGGVEIKCALPHIQVEIMLAGGFPSEHRAQIQGCMWVTGRKWWDFVRFCPDMPERLRCYVFRVERDDAYIATLATEVARFDAEVGKLYNQLMGVK